MSEELGREPTDEELPEEIGISSAKLSQLRAPFPNHINLDTESGESSWHAASESWVPEDGLYDHLVMKLEKT